MLDNNNNNNNKQIYKAPRMPTEGHGGASELSVRRQCVGASELSVRRQCVL